MYDFRSFFSFPRSLSLIYIFFHRWMIDGELLYITAHAISAMKIQVRFLLCTFVELQSTLTFSINCGSPSENGYENRLPIFRFPFSLPLSLCGSILKGTKSPIIVEYSRWITFLKKKKALRENHRGIMCEHSLKYQEEEMFVNIY